MLRQGQPVARAAARVVALACALVTMGALAAAPARAWELADGPREDPRPDIVVVYLDDVAPHDGRLWSSRKRTPALHDHFIGQGTSFSSAVVETPLCCPGRAGFLTGLHTHDSGVIANDALLLDPRVHVGSELRDVGYTTMFIGKYLNRADVLTQAQWDEHESGWDHLDVIDGPNGDFIDYTLHTKEGDVAYPSTHSTKMVASRAVERIRAAPADRPIFAVLSVYDMHEPNTPMAGFAGSPLCEDIRPWAPPNYDEADVSDKPAWLQQTPRLGGSGWSMVRYCEEALGVDRLVARVTAELAAQGRLEDTLLVFTADNGVHWGAHRLGQRKSTPYSTPVPLYMTWPAAWGTGVRRIDEVVSNIDLAPTFCELAGCEMGPYPDGQRRASGRSLVPLLDGSATALERDVVLEEMLAGRAWSGVRTGAAYPGGRWHYVEWASGERELYDLAADPWQLENAADDPATAAVVADLSDRLARARSSPSPGARLDPPTHAFGSIVTGTASPPLGVTLHNDGAEPIDIESVTLAGIGRAAFSADASDCTSSVVLPFSSCSIDVVFTPSSVGTHRATLAVLVAGAGAPARTRLSGVGVPRGSIRIDLDALPDGPRDFRFSGDLGRFSLDDEPGGTVSRSRVVRGLLPGTYAVTQDDVAGWSLTGIRCSSPELVALRDRRVTIRLTAGEAQRCTFVDVERRPDAHIATSSAGPYAGDGVYSPDTTTAQTVRRDGVAAGVTYWYWVNIQNDSLAVDTLRVRGEATGSPSMSVEYRIGSEDVTAAVEAGTLSFTAVPVGGVRRLKAGVTVAPDAASGDSSDVRITATSASRPARTDVVDAVTTTR